MSVPLTVWCLGSKATPRGASEARHTEFFAEPAGRLATISAGRLGDRIATATTELIGFVDAAAMFPADAFDRAAERLRNDSALQGVILSSPSPIAGFNRWERLPLRVASLIQPIGADTALVLRRSVLESLPLNEVPSPLWDWLIRAVAGGQPFETLPVDEAGVEPEHLPELAPRDPGAERRWLAAHLRDVQPAEFLGQVRSRPDAEAVKAGLFQLRDDLDESHSVSQSLEGEGRHRAADYWHAIMHRREPDDSNSKYWFRRVGQHPIFPHLAQAAGDLFASCPSPAAASWSARVIPGGRWDPFAFVDFCAHCRDGRDDELERTARKIQLVEMWLLLEQTLRDATQ